MTASQYIEYGVTLRPGQAKKIYNAQMKGNDVTLELSKGSLQGSFKLPLTHTQINKISKATGGIRLTLSKSQLNHMKKTGGFLPLAALIPALGAVLGGVGGLASGVASAVNSTRNTNEQARHNKAMEEAAKSGSGLYLKPVLEKLGLGINDINKLERDGCICHGGLEIKTKGNGLFLAPK